MEAFPMHDVRRLCSESGTKTIPFISGIANASQTANGDDAKSR
jgi:hypothetical protein